MQGFEDEHGLTFPTVRDDDGALFAHFGVPQQPAWVFVSRNGESQVVLGAMEKSELSQHLQALAAPA